LASAALIAGPNYYWQCYKQCSSQATVGSPEWNECVSVCAEEFGYRPVHDLE
jgi:hypothetical protein